MQHRVLGLAGPTAAGKSAAALALARVLPLEIVSVDSALVYCGMDIGTAKPRADERAQVPHHLIDIREPSEAYSAAQFATDARRLIEDINARGKLALLTGGTMLYFKALIDGIDAMPAAAPALRREIEAEAARDGWPALHAQLQRIDPPTADRLPPTDAQRIQRALEVFRVSGRPLSEWHQAHSRERIAVPLLSLEPRERGWLHARIAERFRHMLDAGLVDEVRRLRARGDLHAGLPSMRCVGYRQAWAALDAGTLDQLAEQGIAATRQLAKRQLTWLRSMRARRVIACDDANATRQLVDAALAMQGGPDAAA
jgi:tRNA dimethylallyltransferase